MANQRFPWFPDWHGELAIIVAAGRSARKANLSLAKGRARFIVVNESWRLAPWADVLYGADSNWWRKTSGLDAFSGLKVSQSPTAATYCKGVKRVFAKPKCDDLLLTRLGTIGWGGNSGFQAFNLALQFGAKKLILVGFDMHGSHWHGPHKRGLKNPSPHSFSQWIKSMDRAAAPLEALGVEVINACTSSALRSYQKMSFPDAIIKQGDKQ